MLNTTGLYSKAADYVRNTRNPNEINLDELDDATFAIQFYDRLYSEIEHNDTIIPMQSDPIEGTVSPLVFVRGKLLSPNELAEEYPEKAIKIIPQLEQFNCSHVVKVFGVFKPFSAERDIFWKPKYEELYYERFPHGRT